MNEDFMLAGISYQRRFLVCNKPICRCHDGRKHGPYWYAYGKKLVYLGKELPAQILVDLAELKCKQEVIKKKVKSLDAQESLLVKELNSIRDLKRNLLNYSYGRAYDISCLRSLRIERTRKK